MTKDSIVITIYLLSTISTYEYMIILHKAGVVHSLPSCKLDLQAERINICLLPGIQIRPGSSSFMSELVFRMDSDLCILLSVVYLD